VYQYNDNYVRWIQCSAELMIGSNKDPLGNFGLEHRGASLPQANISLCINLGESPWNEGRSICNKFGK